MARAVPQHDYWFVTWELTLGAFKLRDQGNAPRVPKERLVSDPQLYDVANDPAERVNRIKQRPDIAAAMRVRLDGILPANRWRETARGEVHLDAAAAPGAGLRGLTLPGGHKVLSVEAARPVAPRPHGVPAYASRPGRG